MQKEPMLQHKVERGSVQQIYGKELSRCMFEKRVHILDAPRGSRADLL